MFKYLSMYKETEAIKKKIIAYVRETYFDKDQKPLVIKYKDIFFSITCNVLTDTDVRVRKGEVQFVKTLHIHSNYKCSYLGDTNIIRLQDLMYTLNTIWLENIRGHTHALFTVYKEDTITTKTFKEQPLSSLKSLNKPFNMAENTLEFTCNTGETTLKLVVSDTVAELLISPFTFSIEEVENILKGEVKYLVGRDFKSSKLSMDYEIIQGINHIKKAIEKNKLKFIINH